MGVTATVHARLAGDTMLTAMLATFNEEPAVLSGDEDKVLEAVDAPFVLIAGPEGDEAFDVKDIDGREQSLAIRFYTPATGSLVAIEAIGERIRTLLHRRPVGLAPGAFIAECSGPVVAPTDRSFYGRQITLRLVSLPTNP